MSSVHEEMKEGAREKKQPGEHAEEVRPVFAEEKEGGDTRKPTTAHRARTEGG
jgi:hypothetical protein